MEDRRISKRKIKRPSYLDNFHIGDSKDSKPADSGNKIQDAKKSSEKDCKTIKIKPRSSNKEGKKETQALKRDRSVTSATGRGLEKAETQKKEESLFSKILNHDESKSAFKNIVNDIKTEMNSAFAQRCNLSSTEFPDLDKKIESIRQKCKECPQEAKSSAKNIIHHSFFDGDLSPEGTLDQEMGAENEGSMPVVTEEQPRPSIPSLGAINPSLLTSQAQNRLNRQRIMSENVDLNMNNRDRTFSLFDLLMNSRQGSTQPHSGNPLGAFAEHRESLDKSNLSSALIETLLTEYLISLPSSLEEFYKIMGEIYVSEILRQCPHITSPIQLMKMTVLGDHSANTREGNKNVLNSLIQNILHFNTRQNTALNTLEGDMIRKILAENPPPKPSAYPTFPSAPETPENQPLNMPPVTPFKKKSPPKQSSSEKISKTQKRRVAKQESKRAEMNMVPSVVSESAPSVGNLKDHQIMDHIPLMQRAKRLLAKKKTVQNSYKGGFEAKRPRIGEEEDFSMPQIVNSITDCPEELRPGAAPADSSATVDTIRVIFDEILAKSIESL